MSIAKPLGLPGHYFEAMGISPELCRRIIQTALSRGGDDCDLYFQHSAGSTLQLTDGKVNNASTSLDLGMGVRVIQGDQVGYSYSEDLSIKSLLSAAKIAAEIAHSGETKTVPLPTLYNIPNYYPVQKSWDQVGMTDRVKMVQKWEKETFDYDARVRRVDAYLIDGASVVMIVRADGRMVEDWRPSAMGYVRCTVEENGVTESNAYNVAARGGLEYFTPERQRRLVTESADRALFQLHASSPPAGEMPVVLAAGASAILLHEAIGHGLEADFNRKNISIFSSKMNQRIANEHVTIVDDGTILNGRGSINVDDEGNDSQRTTLVEDGVLCSYLHDSISARHYGLAPTGNGRRESFRHAPMPRMRTTIMENGPHSPEEIIASVDKGIYCASFANGQVNIGGGDYAFYVKHGFLIENGKLTQPIKDVNIIGNGPDSLSKMDMIGNDLKIDEGGWTCGKEGQGAAVSQGMPTVRVSSLTVGGLG